MSFLEKRKTIKQKLNQKTKYNVKKKMKHKVEKQKILFRQFRKFFLDTENTILHTHSGNIKFAYDVNKEPIVCAIDVTRSFGYEHNDEVIHIVYEC